MAEIGPKSNMDWEIESAADTLIRASSIKKELKKDAKKRKKVQAELQRRKDALKGSIV